MILAGIDEAGYGPLLGPLVVGCCAIRVPDAPEPPDLWSLLRGVVCKSRDRAGRKLHINDSKQVYTPARGLKELERSVLALAGVAGAGVESLDGLVASVDPEAAAMLSDQRWYGARDAERFPLEVDAAATRIMVNALGAEMSRRGAAVAYLGAKISPEKRLNHLFQATRNKSSVLFTLSAIHIDCLLRDFGRQRLIVHCDRQGGREHYGSLLRLMFEDWSLVVVREEEGQSEYELHRQGNIVRILFREKAEAQWMPVAVASMLAKYLREALMARFNAWWAERVPGIAPTAGYYTDGQRFLADTEKVRRSLGIVDAEMIRAR